MRRFRVPNICAECRGVAAKISTFMEARYLVMTGQLDYSACFYSIYRLSWVDLLMGTLLPMRFHHPLKFIVSRCVCRVLKIS